MNIWLILLILLLLGAFGAAPSWGYHQMGWGPSGGLGLVVLVLIILLVMGKL